MTPAEAIAVVREAHNHREHGGRSAGPSGFPGCNACAALGFIEQRMEELGAFRLRGNARRLAEAEARIAQLEEALQRIAAAPSRNDNEDEKLVAARALASEKDGYWRDDENGATRTWIPASGKEEA